MSSLEKCLTKGSRLQAFFKQQGQKRRFKEWNFRTDDVDDLLSQGVTFQALCSLLEPKSHPVVWMGEDAFIRSRHPSRGRPLCTLPEGFSRLIDFRLFFSHNDNVGIHIEVYGRESSTSSYASLLNLLLHLIALEETICEVELRLPSFDINSNSFERPVLTVPPSALERFLSNAQGPRQVYFLGFSISEEQGRVLFFQCNPDVLLGPIDLRWGLHDRGQSLFDALASNESPTSLSIIDGITDLSDELFQSFLLGLRGNSTLRKLDLNGRHTTNKVSPQRMHLILEALTGNLGLESLDLSDQQLSLDDDNWDTLWVALSHHPRIKCVHAWDRLLRGRFTQEQKVRRTQSIVRALETNIHLSIMNVYDGLVDDELMKKSVLPTLEINLFRPRIQAIFQEPDQSLRWKILGRALQHRRVQNNLTIFYLLLSKNADLFQSHAPTQAGRLAIRQNGVVNRQCLLDEEFIDHQGLLYEEREMREADMPIPPSPSPPSRHHYPQVDADQQCSHKDESNKRQRRS